MRGAQISLVTAALATRFTKAIRHARMPTREIMKKIILIAAAFALISSATQLATAGDKELIQSACAALKAPSKRTSCLDALGRMLAPPVAPAPEPALVKPPKLSLRGMDCEAYEFSEINSFSVNELEALYCSYTAGINSSETATNKMIEKYNDPRMEHRFLQIHIKKMEKCMSSQTKVRELATRKFPSSTMECGKFTQKIAETIAPPN